MTTIVLINLVSLNSEKKSKSPLDRKMASLENVYHDFPRLAKQSGFHFQLHRGRVNWSEIENLNIDEITKKNNFYLLERNLLNVINCNLEREYDLKILDPNFVKLFKLAQLGVDYLCYCEMYLDRCVILLQEQLITFQEECESLKLKNQKAKEEMNKIKKKNKTQNYQCEKCDKVFISDVYLKYHNKRRHSSSVIPEITYISHREGTGSYRQTDDEGKLSTSTQTLFPDEAATVNQNFEDPNSIKEPLIIKIENLEQELEDLKERLKKAESTLSEKTEATKSKECLSFNIPGPMHCNSMLMLLPSCLTQLSNSCYGNNPSCQVSVPEVHRKNNTLSSPSVNFETVEGKPLANNFSETNSELKKPFEKECELTKDELTYNTPVESAKGYQSEETGNLEYNKENIDPNKRNNLVTNMTKPLPPPRKSKKKGNHSQFGKEDKVMVEPPTVVKSSVTPEEKSESFSSHLIVNRSTPKKEKLSSETISEIFEGSKDNLSEINKPTINLNDSLNSLSSKKSVLLEPESEFFTEKIINRNSSKLRKLSKNFKSSLASFYDSVSFIEKDLNNKESSKQNLKTVVVDKLNNHLRRLGVDPEWSGIPKKTLKQKLNVLKHSRRILSKENPTYPVIRQNIEEKLFQKLMKSLGKKKIFLINKFNKHRSTNIKSPTAQDSLTDDKLEFVRSKNFTMYDIEVGSEATSSDSEKNFSLGTIRQNDSQKSIIVEDLISCGEYEKKMDIKNNEEFDLSVFQVGRSKSLAQNATKTNRQKQASIKKTDEILTDSDNEYNFLEHLNDKSFITPEKHLSKKSGDENTDLEENCDINAYQFKIPSLENSLKMQHPIIMGENTSQSKLTMNDKKKVFFANCANNFDGELSDSPTDDELWSFRSELAKNVELNAYAETFYHNTALSQQWRSKCK